MRTTRRSSIKFTAIAETFVAVVGVVFTRFSDPRAAAQQGRDELRIELTASGFTPSEVQHAAGRFAIAVENRTLSGEYTLQLKAEDGTVVNEVHVQKGSSAWTLDLQTGTYTLTEANHAEWTCRIVIQ